MKFSALALSVSALALGLLSACQPQGTATNTVNRATSNSNANVANLSPANTNISAPSAIIEAKEPEKYQAVVKLNFEAIGEQQNAALPALTARVARNGVDRRMEFTLPTGDKVVYLDTAQGHFVVLPNRRQYAELTRDTLGFDARRLMMPEQIVDQVKTVPGMQRVGEEELNGRRVVRYRYAATADTASRAGQVGTESYLLIDADTGLPIRTETVSQSQSGGNVQGYKGLKIVTEMSDISTEPDPALFTVPTDFAKVDTEQVKAQATLMFNAVTALIGQAVQQQMNQAAPSPTAAK